MVVCSGGREEHVCPFGRVELIRSRDEGRTWTWPRTLLDGPIDDRDAGLLETSRGTLLATTFTSLAYEPILKKRKESGRDMTMWDAVHERIPEEERRKELGQWIIRSVDGGITWSSRYSSIVNSPHGPIQLSDGRLLYPGKELWAANPWVGMSESDDDGVTWKRGAALPTRKGDDHRAYHELHGVEAKGGRIIVHVRNHNPTHNRETLQSESLDGGKTWSEPHSIGVWGLPSHLLRLRDGRLLMSYGYRRKPYGNQIRVSEDDGKTWSAPAGVSEDGIGGDLGYPSTAELADGRLVTVWYEKMQGSAKAVLRQAIWRLV